jgi:hypothetical protein
MKLKVLNCVYHRNGITGIGFYAVEFKYQEDGKERHGVATIDSYDVDKIKHKEPHNPGTRILMLDEAGGVDLEQTMRGDNFHDDLCKWIIADRSKK